MKQITAVFLLLPGLLLGQISTQRCGHSTSARSEKNTREITSQEAFDMKYLFLDLEVSNLNTNIKGSATLLVEITEDNTQLVELELSNSLSVTNVQLNSQQTAFTHSSDLLSINAPTPYQKGDLVTIKTDYNGEANPASSGIFSGINSRASGSWGNQITWTLSEPFNAHTWWPVKQVLTDKIDSSRVYITTESHLKAGSNGLLLNITSLGNNKIRHEWKSSYPIAYYLVAFSVGEYVEHVNYAKPDFMEGDSLMIQNYIYNNPETLPYYQDDLDMIPEMVELFSDLYGPYPFAQEKYGHMMAPFSGGMEHQTMSTMGLFTFGLNAHELAHQWFGDQVTCGSWRDIWINEGFARFSEYLAAELLLNKNAAQDVINSDLKSVLSLEAGAVYVPENEQTDERIFDFQLTYQKGGLTIRMLRNIVKNDEVFFEAFRSFLEKYEYQTATGEDFRAVLETETGIDFQDFFDQWYYGEGYPVYDIQWSKTPIDSLTINVKQRTTGITPLFTTPLEFHIQYQSGVVKRILLHPERTEETFVISADGNVRSLTFDRNNWLIKEVDRFVQLDSNGNPILHSPKSPELLFYPNPASNHIFFQRDVQSLKIYDLLGNLVIQKDHLNADQKLDIAKLPNGIYYLTTNGDNRPVKLMIKN